MAAATGNISKVASISKQLQNLNLRDIEVSKMNLHSTDALMLKFVKLVLFCSKVMIVKVTVFGCDAFFTCGIRLEALLYMRR